LEAVFDHAVFQLTAFTLDDSKLAAGLPGIQECLSPQKREDRLGAAGTGIPRCRIPS
jgi:hypothetical protein